jgi:hypothetical protein
MYGLRDLAWLAGEGIASEVRPDCPDTFATLALGAAHVREDSEE